MNLGQFKKVVSLLVETTKMVEDSSKYIRKSVFKKHNELICTLLESIYDKEAISYILYEWLTGNRAPLKVHVDETTDVVYPLETIEDLYKAMELYTLPLDK